MAVPELRRVCKILIAGWGGTIMPTIKSDPRVGRGIVVIVTSDESVPPEAEAYLSGEYDLCICRVWDELIARVKREPPHAAIVDIDVVGDDQDEGLTAITQLRSLLPDGLLAVLTRSHSKGLRYKAIDATVDEYFVAPINFEEVRIVLGRALDKRRTEIEHRERLSSKAGQESYGEFIGT